MTRGRRERKMRGIVYFHPQWLQILNISGHMPSFELQMKGKLSFLADIIWVITFVQWGNTCPFFPLQYPCNFSVDFMWDSPLVHEAWKNEMPFHCHKKVIILHLLIKATVLIFLFTRNFMTTALIESPSAAVGLFFMLTSLDIIYREVFSYLLS